MARPSKEQLQTKRLESKKLAGSKTSESASIIKQARELISKADESTTTNGLKLNEAIFARLVAEDGATLTDAYKEAFKPGPDVGIESIHVMASRVKSRLRVGLEIERIQRELIAEDAIRNNLVARAMNGAIVAQDIATRMYIILNSPTASMVYVTKAAEILGRMQHVNAFVNSLTSIDASTHVVNNNLEIKAGSSADQARAQLMESLENILESAQQIETIDVTPQDALQAIQEVKNSISKVLDS